MQVLLHQRLNIRKSKGFGILCNEWKQDWGVTHELTGRNKSMVLTLENKYRKVVCQVALLTFSKQLIYCHCLFLIILLFLSYIFLLFCLNLWALVAFLASMTHIPMYVHRKELCCISNSTYSCYDADVLWKKSMLFACCMKPKICGEWNESCDIHRQFKLYGTVLNSYVLCWVECGITRQIPIWKYFVFILFFCMLCVAVYLMK